MTSFKLRPGASFAMGNNINTVSETQVMFYPDSQNVGTPPANSSGLAKSIADSDFNYAAGVRSARLISFWCGLGSGAGFEIRSHDGSVLYFSFAAAAFGPTSLIFGPDGVILPDGFRIDVLGGATTADFLITYEVV